MNQVPPSSSCPGLSKQVLPSLLPFLLLQRLRLETAHTLVIGHPLKAYVSELGKWQLTPLKGS